MPHSYTPHRMHLPTCKQFMVLRWFEQKNNATAFRFGPSALDDSASGSNNLPKTQVNSGCLSVIELAVHHSMKTPTSGASI